MKFACATITILSASSVAAFMTPANRPSSHNSREAVLSPEETTTEGATKASDDRPIFDPLGLYPESSDEYRQGRIRVLEPTLEVTKPVVDPMGLYPTDSDAYLESFENEQSYSSQDRPLYDPLRLYTDNTEERQNGEIQSMMEPEITAMKKEVKNQRSTRDPLGLYPKDSATYQASLEFEKESLVSKNRQLYDPLGLYSEASVERQEGRILPSVQETATATKKIVDPMNLYEPDQIEANEVDQNVVMSQALPFLPQPTNLDGSLVGDFGFDPLGLAGTGKYNNLSFMRQAELKHARIAMLASAGWAMSELFDKPLAAWLHMKPLLVAGDRVPSILNGGLSHVNPFYWMGILAFAGLAEGLEMMKAKDGWAVGINDQGRPGFDPLNLFPKDVVAQERMQLAELKNGRVAMLAITAFALIEAFTKTAVF